MVYVRTVPSATSATRIGSLIYISSMPSSPVTTQNLSAPTAKVTRAIARLEQGNVSNVKSVGEGVLEYRIDFGPGYRVYYGRDGEVLVILLTGGTKKRQQRDIDAAHAFWHDYKQASAGGAERRRRMARTKSFKDLVQQNVKDDKKFA